MDTTQIDTRKSTGKNSKPGKSTKSPVTKTSNAGAGQSQPTKASTSSKIAYQNAAPVTAQSKHTISPQQRYEMIATTAYFMAERSGFCVDSTQNWLAAEQLIDQQLNAQQSKAMA